MSLLNIGSQSRKTGIFARSGAKRDANNLEDLDDFFQINGSDEPTTSTVRQNKRAYSSRKSSAQSTPSRTRQTDEAPRRTPNTRSRISEGEELSDSSDSAPKNKKDGSVEVAIDIEDEPLPPVGYEDDVDDDEDAADDEILSGVEDNLFPNQSTPEPQEAANAEKMSPINMPAAKKSNVNPRNKKPTKQDLNSKKDISNKKPKPIAKTSSRATNKEAKTTKNIALNKTKPSKQKHVEVQPTRRSNRLKIPPVAFWKNEKVVYDYSDNTHVPSIKDIITVEAEDNEAPKRKTRKRNTAKSNDSLQPAKVQYVYAGDETNTKLDAKTYLGAQWMESGSNTIKVFEGPGSKQKTDRTVAWAANKEVYSQQITTKKDNFKLAILFSEEQEFAASGMLEFPVGGIKHLKNTDDTYFIFYVVAGIIDVTLSGNEFTVKSGCSFEVPMGNFYQFVNRANHPAKLFFVQSKYVVIGEDDDDEEDAT